jgi:signal transduction histidine kinase
VHDSNEPASGASTTDVPAVAGARDTALLDEPPGESFDRLTQLATRVFDTAASFIFLIHADRDRCKSIYGFVRGPVRVRKLDGATFCRYALATREPLVVPETRHDRRFERMPALESKPVRAYLGVPLIDDEGKALGSLCVLDVQPRDWTDDDVTMIATLANSIRHELELQRDLRQSEGLRHVLERRARASALSIAAGSALTAGGPLDHTLRVVAQAIVDHLDAAFARIWILNETEQMLELKASAGMYTDLDGRHSRVKVGALKIGKIAEEKLPHLTNDVLNDPRVDDKVWARRERMVSFAGYPLKVGSRVVGVMAMFARHTLGRDTLDAFESVADGVALAIEQGRTEQSLEQALKLHDEVLAVVSHDLRNPVNTVFMAASLLLDAELSPEKQRAQLEVVRNAALMMNRLIQDLLDASRAEASGLRLELREEAMAPLVREVVDAFALTAAEKQIVLTHEIEPDAPRSRVDRARLIQVLSNLISNALKFTPDGGRITVRLQRRTHELLFSVTDTGIGISGKDIGHVFDRFWQAAKNKRAGVGLGLAICKAVVEAHGGRMWVESQEGKGSTFFFTLPTAV